MQSFHGYHHIGLLVMDLEKSLQFYTQGLGGEIVHHFPMGDTGRTIYLVDLGDNAVVELIPRGTDEPEANARWAHIALNTGDVAAAYDMALAAGAAPKSEPRDGVLNGMAMTGAFVNGPDGEIIEFFHVK